jgi:hypothetical protein
MGVISEERAPWVAPSASSVSGSPESNALSHRNCNNEPWVPPHAVLGILLTCGLPSHSCSNSTPADDGGFPVVVE